MLTLYLHMLPAAGDFFETSHVIGFTVPAYYSTNQAPLKYKLTKTFTCKLSYMKCKIKMWYLRVIAMRPKIEHRILRRL